jgi:sporulation protein YlmC with PRC-barrel domain
MRTLLTTTALVALMSMGAVAQDAANPNLLTEGYSVVDTDGLASKLLGFPVYNAAGNDAEQLGEINDIVIGESGEVSAVIIGVGGFLGVGEKNVAVNYEDLKWVVAEDNTERLVLEVDRAALETAAAVELVDDEPADTAMAPADQPVAPGESLDADATDTATAPAPAEPVVEGEPTETAEAPADPNAAPADDAALETGTVPADPNATTAMDPIDRDVLVDLDELTLTAEELTGTNVYGPDDQHIGVVGDLVLGDDGKAIDALIIDFGGFLGIGTKEVAVAFENLDFRADENGNNRYLLLNVTREQMEAAPAFNRDTYAQERDAQRLVVDGAAATAAN